MKWWIIGAVGAVVLGLNVFWRRAARARAEAREAQRTLQDMRAIQRTVDAYGMDHAKRGQIAVLRAALENALEDAKRVKP